MYFQIRASDVLLQEIVTKILDVDAQKTGKRDVTIYVTPFFLKINEIFLLNLHFMSQPSPV
jgi:hypothetical protein